MTPWWPGPLWWKNMCLESRFAGRGDLAKFSLTDTNKTIFRLASDEARHTISRYRAILRSSATDRRLSIEGFAKDAPLPQPRQPTNGVRKRERDRAQRIRLAGGPRPTIRQIAVALALDKGEVRTQDLTKIGVHRCYLSRMCDEGLLVKVRHGVYRAGATRVT